MIWVNVLRGLCSDGMILIEFLLFQESVQKIFPVLQVQTKVFQIVSSERVCLKVNMSNVISWVLLISLLHFAARA